MARLRNGADGERGRVVRLIATALVPVLLAGCGGGSMFGTSAPPGATDATVSASGPRGMSDRISDFITGSKPAPQASAVPGAPAPSEIDCPPVLIRQGASTLSISDPKAESPAMGVRYQGTIIRTARECTVRDKMVTIRVGVQGRVIVGPAGGPGALTLPLRYALVKEGIEPQAIYSRLYPVSATVEAGQGSALYSHVEEAMTVPMPSVAEFDAYVIYVGFDPQGAEIDKKKSAPPKSRRR